MRGAAQAFLEMRDRIKQHVEQRTAMLAGVSHDLRTVLTRFKLELAFMGEARRCRSLESDVNEMQDMLEDYLGRQARRRRRGSQSTNLERPAGGGA